jgi:two-component system NarL family sensor kinase
MTNFCRVLAVFALVAVLWPLAAQAQTKTRAIRPDLRLVVGVASAGLGGQLGHVQDREEQVRLLRDFVTAARFFPERNGYFFVYDVTGVCVAHGQQPSLVGRSLIDLKDKNGFLVVRALLDKAKAGGGFVEYYWEKPGMPGTYGKLGYVEPIPGTEFVIGSGIYLPENW